MNDFVNHGKEQIILKCIVDLPNFYWMVKLEWKTKTEVG